MKDKTLICLADNQSGAAILELSFCITLILFSIFFIFQIGFAFFNYASLRYTANKVMRSYAGNLGTIRCASMLRSVAHVEAKNILKDSLGLSIDEINIVTDTPAIVAGAKGKPCMLTLQLSKKADCYLCNLWKDGATLSVARAQMIGDDCFDCSC